MKADMKALVLLLFCAPALADPWTGPDKALHLAAGAAVAAGVTAGTRDPWKGFYAGCAVGVLKEAYDMGRPKTHTASVKDAAVTCLGAGLGAAGTGWVLQRIDGKNRLTYSVDF